MSKKQTEQKQKVIPSGKRRFLISSRHFSFVEYRVRKSRRVNLSFITQVISGKVLVVKGYVPKNTVDRTLFDPL